MDINVVLGATSLVLLLALVGFFGYAVREQEANEPKEEQLRGVALLRQHYPAGATLEQPTPYWVAPIPASPDPLEVAGNLDKKIVVGAAMLFALFALTGAYFLAVPAVRAQGAENQLEQRIRRGQITYANVCYDCHGPTGAGIPGGLPLNTAANKYEQPRPTPPTQDCRSSCNAPSSGGAEPAGELDAGLGALGKRSLNDEQMQLSVHMWADPVGRAAASPVVR